MIYKRKDLLWGGKLGTDVSDCHTSREVMEKVGLDFLVAKCECVARMPFSINGNNEVNENMGDFVHGQNIFREVPGAFATYRTDKNIPLGFVGDKYTPVQNIEAFNFFDEAIGDGMAQWEYAGCYGYGHRIYVTAKLPIKSDVMGDDINNYLVFTNSHDGSASIDVMFTSLRMFCFNVLNAARREADAHIRLKHTAKVKDRLHQGAEVLKLACQHAENAQELYNALYTIKMSESDVLDYITKLVLDANEYAALSEYMGKKPIDNMYNFINLNCLTMQHVAEAVNKKSVTQKANVIRTMLDYYKNGIGQKEISGTAWGAYNAITGYYSNVANIDGLDRFNSLLYGGAKTKMSNAFNAALDLAEAV